MTEVQVPSHVRRVTMWMRKELAGARTRWEPLSLYERFEHAVVLVLTLVIAIIIAFALWNLVLKIVEAMMASGFAPPR